MKNLSNLKNRMVHASLGKARRLAAAAGIGSATLLALVQNANAAIDTTAATAGITDAQTAVLAVIAAMITMAVAVWGVRKVLKFFGR